VGEFPSLLATRKIGKVVRAVKVSKFLWSLNVLNFTGVMKRAAGTSIRSCERLLQRIVSFSNVLPCTVGHKSHDLCFHKKYMEAGVMPFVAHSTL